MKTSWPEGLDVSSKESTISAFGKALSTFGRIDVVDNTGYGIAGAFEEYTEGQILRPFDVNFPILLDVTRRAVEIIAR